MQKRTSPAALRGGTHHQCGVTLQAQLHILHPRSVTRKIPNVGPVASEDTSLFSKPLNLVKWHPKLWQIRAQLS
eukprot:1107013-Amphidinium_carterae.1